MLKVGLTGGIGSGKSTIAKIFEVLGIPVYYADAAAKRLMNENDEIKAAVIEHFGNESYNEDGLNRPYISSIVFNNKEKLDLLNAITHPITIADANEWMKKQEAPYVLKEAALLFESGSSEHLDLIIGVYSPKALRLQRTMERDGITRDEVVMRMSRQINEEMKMRLCDFVIVNDEQHMVIPQVMELHRKLLNKSSESSKG